MNLHHASPPSVSREQGKQTNTHLDGHWFVLARVVWVALVFFTGLLVYATHLRQICTSPATSCFL